MYFKNIQWNNENYIYKPETYMKWSTQALNFMTTVKSKIYFCLTEFSLKKIVI